MESGNFWVDFPPPSYWISCTPSGLSESLVAWQDEHQGRKALLFSDPTFLVRNWHTFFSGLAFTLYTLKPARTTTILNRRILLHTLTIKKKKKKSESKVTLLKHTWQQLDLCSRNVRHFVQDMWEIWIANIMELARGRSLQCILYQKVSKLI